jgi:hypothetical protein
MPYSNDKFGIVMLDGTDGTVISSRFLSPAYKRPIIPTDQFNGNYPNNCRYQNYDLVAISGTKTIAISTDY